jgi:structural maintenance of chromosome 1
MGRIDRVVLHNFKSYSGTHTLGPMTDFTAIIGPNGAGPPHLLIPRAACTPCSPPTLTSSLSPSSLYTVQVSPTSWTPSVS